MRAWAVPAVLVLFAAALLWALSVAVARHALDRQAATQAADYAAGASPWHWRLRVPDDVIAGHAFGNATLEADQDGMKLRATGSHRYAIGLPMSRPADLTRVPRLQLALHSTTALRLSVALRERLDGALLTSSPLQVAAGDHIVDMDLPSQAWRDAQGKSAAPTRAAMLRLRVQQPAGTSLTLNSVRLLPASGAKLKVAVAPDVALPPQPARAHAVLARLAQRTPGNVIPVVVLGGDASAEALLAQRDWVHDQLPSAIAAAGVGWRTIQPRTVHPNEYLAWLGLGVYILLLCIVLLRPPRHRRWRAALEIAACTLPPLAWAIGLRGDAPDHQAWAVAVAAAVAFACALEVRRRPRHWRWLSGAWRDWAWPALAVAAALAMLAIWGARPGLPTVNQLLLYLAWALLQQILMLTVVAQRLRALVSARIWAVLGCAFLFALMHTPNGWLMQLTFVAELWWAWCFLRRRVLLPIVLAHAVAALLLQSALGQLPLRSLEIGAHFLR